MKYTGIRSTGIVNVSLCHSIGKNLFRNLAVVLFSRGIVIIEYYALKLGNIGKSPVRSIMGFTGNMDWWDPEFLEALAAKYRLLIFDNRGAGRTVTPSEGQFSIEMFAEDTALLMDKLGIEHAHVFGFSMGGLIAQVLALRHPEKVSKLILGGTFCGGKETVMPSKEVTQKLTDSGGGLDAVCSRTDQAASRNREKFHLPAAPGYKNTGSCCQGFRGYNHPST